MMGIKDFKLKWAHEMCRGKPMFISNNKLLIPSSFFMKSCDLSGRHLRYHFEAGIQIGCISTLPELGIVAMSERKINGAIHILSYPKMSKISVLEQNDNEQYSALQFVGFELLLSLQIKNCYEIDLWKWQSGERVYFLSIPILSSEIPDVNLSCNPIWWYQVLLQTNVRLVLMEVKVSDDKYTLDASSYFFIMDKESNIELSVQNSNSPQKDFQTDIINPMLKTLNVQSICWLPENNILAATSNGILKVEYGVSSVHKLEDNKTGISSMILCKSGLFIGYKTGYIDIINVMGNRWHLMETVNIGQPIRHLFTSPDYNFLTISTIKGSIFYRQMNVGESNIKALLRAEFGGEVGVGFIGPLAQLCVTARKNGFVHIFSTFDGSILSSFQLEDEIVSLATSPLCCYVVIGTNIGFVYFIDVTDFNKPKIVHSERPFEMPVVHLKFDNFGRFLIASAQNQSVKIWNGLPSSGFASLGSKKFTNQVKDITAFSRTVDDETILLILSESGSVSDKEVGNVLIRLKLPLDLGSDPKKYQMDVFGTLSGDALNFQKLKLNKSACKMDAHWNLGAVLYSPVDHKVHRCSVWSDFTNLKQDDILSVKSVICVRISPNHLWIALTDFYGCVYLYSCKELVLSASSDNYTLSENTCKSFVDFPLFSNNLICGRENGVTLCFEWTDDSNILQSVPEWVVYCCSQSEKENKSLYSMEEEERLELISEDIDINKEHLVAATEICHELQVWIHIINFKLDQLYDEKDLKNELSLNTFVFSEDSLVKLSLENRRKLSLVTSEKSPNEEKTRKKPSKENAVKVLSSINLGLVTQSYSKESIDNDINQTQTLNLESDVKTCIRSLSTLSFCKSVKMKCKEERLSTMRDLINRICDLKIKFNEEFENLYKVKPNISDRLNGTYFEAKRLSQTLPSKAERDFWSASVIQRNFGRLFGNIESIGIKNEIQTPNKDAIKETKSSIEHYIKSSRNVQEDFDSSIEVLLLKKQYCDFKIFRLEVKMHSILLFTEVEDEFSNWSEDTAKVIKLLEVIENDIDGLLKEFTDIAISIKDVFAELQMMERKCTKKIEVKCQKMAQVKETVFLRKKQPILQLDSKSQNPFWRTCPCINTNDLAKISKEFRFQSSCPIGIQKTEWENVCNKQIRVLKIGVIMRNLQNQMSIITNTKQLCADADHNIKIIRETIQKVFKDMSILISKFSISFHTLVTTQLESMDLQLEEDTNSKTKLSPLSRIPESDHRIWKDIDREAYRIQKVESFLVEIEQNHEYLNKLKSEMSIKCTNIRKEVMDLLKQFNEKLDECKQNLTRTKFVADDVLVEKNMFKVLKSRFLNENVNHGKIKECK